MVLSAFSPPEKGARRVAETVSCSRFRTSANLIPCPYVPRIANEPSTWPITVHCGTSKTPSNNHLRVLPLPFYVTPLSLSPRRSSPSAFLTEPFRIMESLAEERLVPLNSRPCIFIFRCRMARKKNKTTSGLRIFRFSSRQPTFLLQNFYISQISSNIMDVSCDLK